MDWREVYESFSPVDLETGERRGRVPPSGADTRRAAVLVPVLAEPDGLRIVYTVRKADLADHAGQISFPGGSMDPSDASLLETALREAGEEIDLSPDLVEIVGELEEMYIPPSNFRVSPFVGVLPPEAEMVLAPDEVEEIFTTGKADYIEAFAQRMAPVLAAEKATWASAHGDSLLEPLRERFEPIMVQSDQICDGIGYPVELRIGAETVVVDFPKRVVREPVSDEKFRYGFEIAPELVRTVLRDAEPDWVNTIFLSTRFRAWRVGGYNEYLYTFFKCLTDERVAYADGWFAEAYDDSASITMGGYEFQRRCPHLKADLSKFGVVEGNTLTCNLHGWQWNLDNGRCLTTKGHELRTGQL